MFGYNAATGDRRISGSAAALAGLDQAVADGDAAATDLAVARLLLAYALVLGWGGVPVLWMGDELGLPNDAHWADEPGHDDDNRWAHRPRMPWATAAQRHDPATVPGRLFTGVRDLARARAALPQLHASVSAQVLDPADPGVFVVLRDHPVGPMLGLYNMTPDWRPHPADHLESLGARWDAITGDVVRPGGDGQVWLPPYAARWIIPSPP